MVEIVGKICLLEPLLELGGELSGDVRLGHLRPNSGAPVVRPFGEVRVFLEREIPLDALWLEVVLNGNACAVPLDQKRAVRQNRQKEQGCDGAEPIAVATTSAPLPSAMIDQETRRSLI